MSIKNLSLADSEKQVSLYVKDITLDADGSLTSAGDLTLTAPSGSDAKVYNDTTEILRVDTTGADVRSGGLYIAGSAAIDSSKNFIPALTSGAASTNVSIDGDGKLTDQSVSLLKYKKKVVDLDEVIETKKIYDLVPRKFVWKKDNTDSMGFIAEEVEKLFPQSYICAYDKEGKLKGVRYELLAVLALQACKDLNERLKELE